MCAVRHRGQRIEIPRRQPEAQVALRVAEVGLDQGVVRDDAVFQDMLAAAELPPLSYWHAHRDVAVSVVAEREFAVGQHGPAPDGV